MTLMLSLVSCEVGNGQEPLAMSCSEPRVTTMTHRPILATFHCVVPLCSCSLLIEL
ncbi:hypothetical protein LIA77_08000 [Sarocladium implicatum]|nr:hypothetical protein LIA77_08000 [Sarocladium implicatum]